ncbi:tigger transposable element-derived protein 1 [Trichonephila clavipes]|nr:tigger transposable element-derived protein 1 [Trichonephila clavipes]
MAEHDTLKKLKVDRAIYVFSITETLAESEPKLDGIEYLIEGSIDLARQIHLEVDSDDVQELLDSFNQELTMDELIEVHEKEQDIEEHEFLDSIQSEDRMVVGFLTEAFSLIEKELQILENTFSNEKRIFSNKTGNKKIIACLRGNFPGEKKNL